jgi:hypothetical protein
MVRSHRHLIRSHGANCNFFYNRFATRARRFMDAYYHGLNGKQAAWAAQKYRGHRVIPESVMDDLMNANIS